MTVTAGVRPSKRQVVGSAQASARGADGPLPVSAGGTGGTTVGEARANLDVPGLGKDNRFTGVNVFDGGGITVDAGGIDVAGGTTSLGRTEWGGTIMEPPNFTMLSLSVNFAYVAKTTTYTATDTDCIINATSGTWTLSLPAAATASAGRLYIVKNSGAGTITLATTGGDTIDGALTQTLAPYNSITVVSTGSAWIIV